MDKQHILDEIRRTADGNDGKPLGIKRFEAATGIVRSDFLGKHWARWGDALAEAGFAPNTLQKSRDATEIIDQLAVFIDELGRYPTVMEIRLRAKQVEGFPWHNTFARLGDRAGLAVKVIKRCKQRGGLENVIAICEPIAAEMSLPEEADDEAVFGYVYLIKSGKHYKIGRTNSLGRREYELAIQLPERATTVHTIKTDDPPGIEAYWHRRFTDRHKNGEWFELTAADVKSFRRRKFM